MTNEQTKQKMHPYSQVLQWVAEGKEIEAQHFVSGEWVTVEHTTILKIAALGIDHPFYRSVDYRLKPERHIHQDLIDAWNGAEIQVYDKEHSFWQDVPENNPFWIPNCKYRIKPEPKPDIVGYVYAIVRGAGFVDTSHSTETPSPVDNIKIVFDGETRKLKSVEIIND